ncbi:MAG: hypothetical protein ACYS74_14575 [Planctomycetota bacterium]
MRVVVFIDFLPTAKAALHVWIERMLCWEKADDPARKTPGEHRAAARPQCMLVPV